MKLFTSILAILLLAILAATATPVYIHVDTWLNEGDLYGGSATVSTDGGQSWRGDYAGQFKAQGANVNWVTYCTDVNYWLADGYYNAGSPDVNVQHSPTWTGNYGLAESVYLEHRGDVDSNTKAVALQLAIWEALQDNDLNLLSGNFRTTESAAEAQAQTWLNGITAPVCGTWWEPTDANGNYRQNQGLIGERCSVPDAGSSALLLLFGIAALLACYRQFPATLKQAA
jgi:hypothetical protein